MDRNFHFEVISNIAGRYRIATLCNDDFSFECGQYLNLVSLSGKEIPLSIASSPLDLPKLKVIYRPEFSNPDSLLLEKMLDQQTVDASSSLGSVRYPLDDKNLVLICKGTGISQAASMTEQCKLLSSPRKILLIWNTDDSLEAQIKDSPETWFPSIDQIVSNHQGLQNYLETQRTTLNNAHCIITGDPEFVYTVHDTLLKHDFFTASIQSDVFDYAPRCL